MGGHDWPTLLATLLARVDLSAQETAWAMGEVMAGEATPAQVAGFLVALRAKGETAAEVTGLVQAMLDHAAPLVVPVGRRLVDTCGTGGDRAHTVNISTMAAMVVAGTGATVAKHGNRASSSACGSADLLEELGVVVDLPPAGVARCLDEAGIAFCFAPVFHASMRHAAGPRRELGVPTVFNVLGPLTNPARPHAQAVGVSDRRLAPVLADVLAGRGASALVFRGSDGLDELTTSTTSEVWWVRDGAVTALLFDPSRLGLSPPPEGALRGGDAAVNAAVARELLAGRPGPVREAVALNAAAALVAYAPGWGSLEDQLAAALVRAVESLDSGAAAAALDRWVTTSQAVSTTP